MADDDTTGSTEATPATGGAAGSATTGTETAAPQGAGTVPAEVQRALHKANKEAEQYRLKLKEFEDRDKTEAEKLAERATTAEKTAADATSKLLRYEVAAEKNLPLSMAARLQGSTREELMKDADNLTALLAAQAQSAAPSFDGGVRTAPPAAVDMDTRIRQQAGFQ